ncbi:MAG: hypothetical protein HXY18_15135, partial [Bryobacteraceae bacterium]|nr:hypothetical protein [Bryobacteraceae bacterium]
MACWAMALLAPAAASGAYTWWVDQYLGTYNTYYWYATGYWNFTGTIFTSSHPDGATLLPPINVPITSDTAYEVSTQLFISASGGGFIHYVRSNSHEGSYTVALKDITKNGSACQANLVASRVLLGSVTELGRVDGVACRDWVEMRTVVTPNHLLYVYLDSTLYGPLDLAAHIPFFPTGGLAIGVKSAPIGNGIYRARLGPKDMVAPNAIPASSVISQPWQGSIDLAWQGSTDDANGRGFLDYEVYRNGSYMATLKEPGFTDQTVAAGTQYTYTIVARDQHLNTTSVQHIATALANATVNPRKVGLRPLGTYWGAAGENIDMGSGNLNYTVGVLGAKSRGIAARLALSYNSQ